MEEKATDEVKEESADEAKLDARRGRKHAHEGDAEIQLSRRDKTTKDRHRESDRDRSRDRERDRDRKRASRDGDEARRKSDRERRGSPEDKARERGRWRPLSCVARCYVIPTFVTLQPSGPISLGVRQTLQDNFFQSF